MRDCCSEMTLICLSFPYHTTDLAGSCLCDHALSVLTQYDESKKQVEAELLLGLRHSLVGSDAGRLSRRRGRGYNPSCLLRLEVIDWIKSFYLFASLFLCPPETG